MEDFFGVLALCLLSALLSSGFTEAYSEGNKAKTECEKTLPRDQHCVITAVPEKTK